MTKFRTQFQVYEPDVERFIEPSQTMPSQAYTIRELLSRFVSGTYSPEQAYRNGSYADGDPDYDDWDETDDPAFDLADYTAALADIEYYDKVIKPAAKAKAAQSLESVEPSEPAEPVA